MSKIYHIREEKVVIYTYKVYAKTKAEALGKFNSHDEYEEIGLDPIKITSTTVSEMGQASDKCATCNNHYSPENVSDYLCQKCQNERDST